LLLYVSARIH